MSLSNPQMMNPATKFLHWASQTNEEKGLTAGTFYYYDKESKKNVTLELPLYMIVLDQLSTISGYHEGSGSGIFSNEVKFLNTEILNVRSFAQNGGFRLIGKYSDISADIKANGGKFTKSVYAVIIQADSKLEVVNFQLHGASFAAWVEAAIKTDAYGVKCVKFEEKKKGANKYQSPIFEALTVGKNRKDIWAFAINADKQLQAFIKSRKEAQLENEAAKDEGAVKEELPDEWLSNSNDVDELPY